MIEYKIGGALDLNCVIELYNASTLGERRPVHDRARMSEMFKHANLIVTAWEGDVLVGVARALSDFSYVTYLSDLAVRVSHQKKGIGRELISKTLAAGGADAKLVLLAAPAAEKYYPHIGFEHMPQCWRISPGA